MNELKEFIYECKIENKIYWTKKIEYQDFGSFISCRYYFLRNGEWHRVHGKGIRLIKKIKTNTRGRFIVFENKKFYL